MLHIMKMHVHIFLIKQGEHSQMVTQKQSKENDGRAK